jgi:hypothetical protein
VLLYQLLAGRLPFEAETPTAMIFQHAYEEPFPLCEAAPDVPQAVADIVARMMAKDPDDRYPSCGEALGDLEAFREGRPLSATPSELGKPATTMLPAGEPIAEPELPAGLARLADNRRWVQIRDWATTIFRRHAPEFIQELQNTMQQVDGAVAHYERRRGRLAKLHEEASSLAAELAGQLQANGEALAAAVRMVQSAPSDQQQAALAKKQQYEEHVEALRRQHDEQQRQVEELEHQLGKADATLARLHSQRDVLKARLRAAEARHQLEGGRARAGRPRWLLGVAAAACVILAACLLLLFSDRLDLVPEQQPETTAFTSVPTEPPPPSSDRLELVPEQQPETTASTSVATEPHPPGEAIPVGQWVELLPRVNIRADRLTGEWRQTGDGLTASSGAPAVMRVPVVLEGSYELQVDFTRNAGDDSVQIRYPVGPQHHIYFTLGGWHGRADGFGPIDGRLAIDGNSTSRRPSVLRTGRRYSALLRVAQAGDAVTIEGFLDGEPFTSWAGKLGLSRFSCQRKWDCPLCRRLPRGSFL